jgi:hypothetical protein
MNTFLFVFHGERSAMARMFDAGEIRVIASRLFDLIWQKKECCDLRIFLNGWRLKKKDNNRNFLTKFKHFGEIRTTDFRLIFKVSK